MQRPSQSNDMNRRQVLRRAAAVTAAVAAPTIVSARALGLENVAAASDRITLGVIGIGPRATYDLAAMLKLGDVQCVAIADVQASRREAGKKQVDTHYGNSDCTTVRNFRELLDHKDIDALLIGTGDRWHAPAAILAAEAGKDVYCEKPCAITIDLCRQIDEAFTRTGRIFQAGTQRRSVPNFQNAVELAHAGKIGKLQTLYASVYEPHLGNNWLPGEATPPRDEVDWNLWLGTAPWRPYNQQYVKGGWRGYFDFDAGARLLDWGAHTVDLCQWANQADGTMPVEYEPSAANITATYANGVKLVLDFLKTPFNDRPGWINRLGTCPVRFVGEAGWLETGDSGEIVIEPAALQQELLGESYKRVSGLDVSAHARNFFDCVKSRSQPICNPKVMRSSHIACHAAAFSWILQRKLKLDPAAEMFIDDTEANSLRSRPARDPWAV